MLYSIVQIAWLAVILQTVSADWQFFSRPDLFPPKLNITVPASSETDAGYLFLSLKGTAGIKLRVQPAPYIFRDDGELVWSGLGYYSGYVIDFGVIEYNGKPALRAFQGSMDGVHIRMNGHHAILDEKYKTIATVRAGSHSLASGHEFQMVGGKSALIEVEDPVPTDLSMIGGDEEQKWVISSGFQEIDILTGELIFEWYSLDHVSPNHSMLALKPDDQWSGRNPLDAYHYFAINSVDKDDEGNYLISSRHISAIYKINGTSGEIMWQLGGLYGSDFEVPSDLEFSYQHDARFRYRSQDGSIERISFLNNNNGNAQPDNNTGKVSKISYLELNHTAKSVSKIWTYPSPDGSAVSAMGNLQFLPNGNMIANWGQAGSITEFSEEGTVLFHAYLNSYPNEGIISYRGFRSNWTGISSEEPAVLALRTELAGLMIWISWNGDTETAFWQFHLHDNRLSQNVKLLGIQARQGFETRFEVEVTESLEFFQGYSVMAQALNSTGHTIGKSRPIKIQDDAPYRAYIKELIQDSGETKEPQQGREEL